MNVKTEPVVRTRIAKLLTATLVVGWTAAGAVKMSPQNSNSEVNAIGQQSASLAPTSLVESAVATAQPSKSAAAADAKARADQKAEVRAIAAAEAKAKAAEKKAAALAAAASAANAAALKSAEAKALAAQAATAAALKIAETQAQELKAAALKAEAAKIAAVKAAELKSAAALAAAVKAAEQKAAATLSAAIKVAQAKGAALVAKSIPSAPPVAAESAKAPSLSAIAPAKLQAEIQNTNASTAIKSNRAGEELVVDANAILLTDRRPRVGTENFKPVRNALMEFQSTRAMPFVKIVASDDVPPTHVAVLNKFMTKFYGWPVKVEVAPNAKTFELQVIREVRP